MAQGPPGGGPGKESTMEKKLIEDITRKLESLRVVELVIVLNLIEGLAGE